MYVAIACNPQVDIFSKVTLYRLVYAVIEGIARVPALAFLLDALPDQSYTINALLQEQCNIARDYFSMEVTAVLCALVCVGCVSL